MRAAHRRKLAEVAAREAAAKSVIAAWVPTWLSWTRLKRLRYTLQKYAACMPNILFERLEHAQLSSALLVAICMAAVSWLRIVSTLP